MTINIILNASTLIALVIALVAGGFIAADLYDLVHNLAKQSKTNGVAINETLHTISNSTRSTLHELGRTYDLIIDNQRRIIDLTNLQINITNFQNAHTAENLNLTKLNRATLIDTNHIARELAKRLNMSDLKPFNISSTT